MIRAQPSIWMFIVVAAAAACGPSVGEAPDSAAVIVAESPGAAPVEQAPANSPAPTQSGEIGGNRAGVGALHEIRMVGDGSNFRFEPASISVSAGDVVRFIATDNSPHNVTFDGTGHSSETQTRLDRNIAEREEPLSSAKVVEQGETITVSFAGIEPGEYKFHCRTHAASGMRGVIEVK